MLPVIKYQTLDATDVFHSTFYRQAFIFQKDLTKEKNFFYPQKNFQQQQQL